MKKEEAFGNTLLLTTSGDIAGSKGLVAFGTYEV